MVMQMQRAYNKGIVTTAQADCKQTEKTTGRDWQMKIGALTVPLYSMPLEKALAYLKSIGVQAAEIGCGGFVGNTHCNAKELLADPQKRKAFAALFENAGIELNALSCHGNPIHPDKAIAAQANTEFEDAVHLAQALGVKKVITFSGCAGDSPDARYPNWVTCPWPDDFLSVLDYQWNECLLPYWAKASQLAKSCGVQVALEMHPGFMVYNTASMLRLRAAVGDAVGANFDPSHLIWQGNDIVASIRELQGAIYHFHAKDTKVDGLNTARKGVLDTLPYSKEIERSWIFRTVGYGNGADYWKDIVSALRMVGYDDVVSIEHEDSLMSVQEGLEKAVVMLQEAVIAQPPAEMWWA